MQEKEKEIPQDKNVRKDWCNLQLQFFYVMHKQSQNITPNVGEMWLHFPASFLGETRHELSKHLWCVSSPSQQHNVVNLSKAFQKSNKNSTAFFFTSKEISNSVHSHCNMKRKETKIKVTCQINKCSAKQLRQKQNETKQTKILRKQQKTKQKCKAKHTTKRKHNFACGHFQHCFPSHSPKHPITKIKTFSRFMTEVNDSCSLW